MSSCPHGYPPDDCLICQTLGRTMTAPPARSRLRFRGSTPEPLGASGRALDDRGRRYHPASTAGMVVLIVLAAAVAVWVLAGAVYAIVRIIEILAVAFAAGWVGYRVGHWRGRHER